MQRGPFSPARLQTLTYHLCVELLPPLVYYIWQDVGLHFAFVAYFIHNAIIRIWTPIPSLQFMFTKFVHNFLKIGDLLVTQEDTWLQACPHLLTARPYLFCWLFQECLSKELSEIMFPGSPFFSSVLLSLAFCLSPFVHHYSTERARWSSGD